jgi:hypothetical protein
MFYGTAYRSHYQLPRCHGIKVRQEPVHFMAWYLLGIWRQEMLQKRAIPMEKERRSIRLFNHLLKSGLKAAEIAKKREIFNALAEIIAHHIVISLQLRAFFIPNALAPRQDPANCRAIP